jgi:hypothetical protein
MKSDSKWTDVVTQDRWELFRALGVVPARPAGDTEHTEVFVFNCPPYASAYLGDGVAGDAARCWQALGREVPPEPDHLSTLLDLYVTLGQTEAGEMRQAVFAEDLWPWLPGYLSAVADLGAPAFVSWAEQASRTLRAERDLLGDAPVLPAALRDAPPPLDPHGGAGELAIGLTTPLCSGLILSRRTVAAAAEQVGAGHRIGNRRAALRAMLEAEPERAAWWLAAEADRWSQRHLSVAPGDPVQQWWGDRAASTAAMLRGQAARR